MTERTTRRRFLRNSAIISGAAVLVDPSWAVAARPVADRSNDRRDFQRIRRGMSEGKFAEVRYGDVRGGPIAQWSRLGDDLTLELWPAEIVISVPTRSETVETIPLADFDFGRGAHEIVRDFGEPTLEQLRVEVSSLRVFSPPLDNAA